MTQPITFERFVEAVRGTNPFRSTRVTDPARREGDVGIIHQAAFARLTRTVESVRTEPMASGVLLIGGAGVGKSHLLARLFQWANEDHATVVYLHNVLASPERMFRYVLNATVSDLASHRGAYAESRLYQILIRALLREAESSGFKQGSVEGRREAMHRVLRRADPTGAVSDVFAVFREAASSRTEDQTEAHRRARIAVHYLRGETLDPEDAKLLGMHAPEQGVALADDAAVDHVLRTLSRLCAEARRPLVLCLDQVDNLEHSGLTALASLTQALLDRAQHLVVIFSGVKETLLRLKHDGVIPQAAWDRIAERTVELSKISPDEARAIIENRIEPMNSVFRDVKEVQRARDRDPLFPIGTGWLKEKLGDLPEFRPRDVVTWARDRWEQQQALIEQVGGRRWLEEWQGAAPSLAPTADIDSLIDEEVKRKLLEGVNRRKLQPASLPPDEDNLATMSLTLLLRCVGDSRYTLVDIHRAKSKKVPAYHLLAKERRPDGLTISTGVTFVTAATGHGPRWALARMLDDLNPPDHRILVTDEERRPLKLGKAGREQYDKLCAVGRSRFLHVKLSFDAYAELDAMISVLGDAKSGDLEVEHPRGVPRVVMEAEVLAALHRSGRFLAHSLLRELLTEEIPSAAPPPSRATKVEDVRAREFIMAELSWRLGLMARELAQTFAVREKLGTNGVDHVWARLKEVARVLHEEGKVYATAQDDDLFLQYRKKSE